MLAWLTCCVPPPPACLACLQDQETPLHVSSEARMLIEQRADVNARDKVMGVG